MRILVVEDEPTLSAQLSEALGQAGYLVDSAADGGRAHYLGEVETYDLVVLDLGLPVMDGLTVLKKWRAAGLGMPVLILTARDNWHEKVAGIDAGADDYLTKPFHMEELLARLRALLRRQSAHTSAQWRCGPIMLDTRQARVTVDGQALSLTSHEFKVLAVLMQRAGEVVSRAELNEHIYAQDQDRDSNTIEVFIGRLRRSCRPTPSKPCVAWGIGWRGRNERCARARLAALAPAGGHAGLDPGHRGAGRLGSGQSVPPARGRATARRAGPAPEPADRGGQCRARRRAERDAAERPRLGQPLSGLYWQIDRLDDQGRTVMPGPRARGRCGTRRWPCPTGRSMAPTTSPVPSGTGSRR